MTIEQGEVGALDGKVVRFQQESGRTVEMRVMRIDFPYVEGKLVEHTSEDEGKYTPVAVEGKGSDWVRVDLRTVQQLEVSEINIAKTIIRTVGIGAAVFLVILLIALATKESCPILYVQTADGLQMVGEAYAGAAFKSIKRDDLLPMPTLDTDDTVRLILANEARETQYTDVAELVIADHPAGTRVVSTHQQRPLIVTEDTVAATVSTFDGDDISDALVASDGVEWFSDMESLVDSASPPARDGFAATFPVSQAGARPILELRAANTFLLDVTFGRFFALMGDDLDKYIGEGNELDNRDRITRWRQRQGVDLEVEALTRGGWKRIDSVWTVGPMALRDIAVPLPKEAIVDNSVTVRLSGGTGFWRFDRLALSNEVDTAFAVQRIAPSVALNQLGDDEGALLQTSDERYHVLEDIGDKITLEYVLPQTVPGTVRTTFFYSEGYYNVHPPYGAEMSLGTLKNIRDGEGSLARFALDLVREYFRHGAGVPFEQAAR